MNGWSLIKINQVGYAVRIILSISCLLLFFLSVWLYIEAPYSSIILDHSAYNPLGKTVEQNRIIAIEKSNERLQYTASFKQYDSVFLLLSYFIPPVAAALAVIITIPPTIARVRYRIVPPVYIPFLLFGVGVVALILGGALLSIGLISIIGVLTCVKAKRFFCRGGVNVEEIDDDWLYFTHDNQEQVTYLYCLFGQHGVINRNTYFLFIDHPFFPTIYFLVNTRYMNNSFFVYALYRPYKKESLDESAKKKLVRSKL